MTTNDRYDAVYKAPELNTSFDLLEDASEEFLSKLDKQRFLTEPLYSKTIFACYENKIAYTPAHQQKIEAIDNFISNKGILDVIVAMGRYEKTGYSYVTDYDEWVYVIPAPRKGLIAIVDDISIQVKTIQSAYKESIRDDH